LNQLTERCVSYLNTIAQEHIGERVVVVSHGAAILELCRHTDPPNSSIRRHIPKTSLDVFRVSGVTGQWILERCGDVSHLKEDGFVQSAFGGDGASCVTLCSSLVPTHSSIVTRTSIATTCNALTS
ncbi:hypothetical protein BAE44_0023342, partial [Dichanthelium oligosanthes]